MAAGEVFHQPQTSCGESSSAGDFFRGAWRGQGPLRTLAWNRRNSRHAPNRPGVHPPHELEVDVIRTIRRPGGGERIHWARSERGGWS